MKRTVTALMCFVFAMPAQAQLVVLVRNGQGGVIHRENEGLSGAQAEAASRGGGWEVLINTTQCGHWAVWRAGTRAGTKYFGTFGQPSLEAARQAASTPAFAYRTQMGGGGVVQNVTGGRYDCGGSAEAGAGQRLPGSDMGTDLSRQHRSVKLPPAPIKMLDGTMQYVGTGLPGDPGLPGGLPGGSGLPGSSLPGSQIAGGGIGGAGFDTEAYLRSVREALAHMPPMSASDIEEYLGFARQALYGSSGISRADADETLRLMRMALYEAGRGPSPTGGSNRTTVTPSFNGEAYERSIRESLANAPAPIMVRSTPPPPPAPATTAPTIGAASICIPVRPGGSGAVRSACKAPPPPPPPPKAPSSSNSGGMASAKVCIPGSGSGSARSECGNRPPPPPPPPIYRPPPPKPAPPPPPPSKPKPPKVPAPAPIKILTACAVMDAHGNMTKPIVVLTQPEVTVSTSPNVLLHMRNLVTGEIYKLGAETNRMPPGRYILGLHGWAGGTDPNKQKVSACLNFRG